MNKVTVLNESTSESFTCRRPESHRLYGPFGMSRPYNIWGCNWKTMGTSFSDWKFICGAPVTTARKIVIFGWSDTWETVPKHTRLEEIADVPYHGEDCWPRHGVDAQHSGGNYSHPGTTTSWHETNSLGFVETLMYIRKAAAFVLETEVASDKDFESAVICFHKTTNLYGKLRRFDRNKRLEGQHCEGDALLQLAALMKEMGSYHCSLASKSLLLMLDASGMCPPRLRKKTTPAATRIRMTRKTTPSQERCRLALRVRQDTSSVKVGSCDPCDLPWNFWVLGNINRSTAFPSRRNIRM